MRDISLYAFRRPVENEFLVRQRDRRWRRELAWVLVALLPVALALLVDIWGHFRVLSTGYEIERVEHELRRVEERRRSLRYEVARLSSPARVDALARADGMRPPERTIGLDELAAEAPR